MKVHLLRFFGGVGHVDAGALDIQRAFFVSDLASAFPEFSLGVHRVGADDVRLPDRDRLEEAYLQLSRDAQALSQEGERPAHDLVHDRADDPAVDDAGVAKLVFFWDELSFDDIIFIIFDKEAHLES